MYAVIFSAEINKLDQAYFVTADRLRALALTKYGCVEFTTASEGNQEIAISYWNRFEQISAWKQDPEHKIAQAKGRKTWYKSYRVQVVKLERSYQFSNDELTA